MIYDNDESYISPIIFFANSQELVAVLLNYVN